MKARPLTLIATLLLLGSALGRADPSSEQDPAKAAEAKKAFSAGVAFLQDPDGAKYEEALLQFRRVRQLIGTWKVLGNIGICAMKLERDGEAIEAFEKYLQESGGKLDREEKAQVERDLATLKASVVNVHLVFAPPKGNLSDERTSNRGARIINDYDVSGTTLDLGVHAGRHVMVARLGAVESKWEADLQPGARVEHAFGEVGSAVRPKAEPVSSAPAMTPATAAPTAPVTAAPTASAPTAAAAAADPRTSAPGLVKPEPATGAPSSRPIPMSVWISGGTTIALTIGAVATGVATLSKRSEFNDANGAPGRQADAQSLHDSAVSLAIANTVLSGAAVIGAGLTTYLYLSRPEGPGTRVGRPLVLPWVTVGGAGLSLRSDL